MASEAGDPRSSESVLESRILSTEGAEGDWSDLVSPEGGPGGRGLACEWVPSSLLRLPTHVRGTGAA